MNNQVFKRAIPPNLLYDLLEKICEIIEDKYVLDFVAYKKMIFYDFHPAFIAELRPYYYSAKMFYCDRPLTYNSFANIIRQICKYSGIYIDSEIKYDHSQHYITYYITMP